MNKIIGVFMLLALTCSGGLYKCYTFFDGTEPKRTTGAMVWGGLTNFYGMLDVGPAGLAGTIASASTTESNEFTKVIGPVLTGHSNAVICFGFRGAVTGDTNAIVVSGAGTIAANGTFLWTTDIGDGRAGYSNALGSVIYFEDTTPSWRMTNGAGFVAYTNVTGMGGTWVRGAVGAAPVPNAVWAGTNTAAVGTCTLSIASSYTGTNGWTALQNVTATMDTTNWVRSDTVMLLGAEAFRMPAAYFCVYGGTNNCSALTTNMYLRMFVRE